MKALSIRQPWAHHILHDGKDIENRKWNTKFRGRVFIHAGLQFDKAALGGFTQERICGLPRGGIVGVVTIVDVVTESDSPWFFGPFGFALEDALPIPLVECKGRLGFFETGIDYRRHTR